MHLQHLQTFCRVVDQGSFTKAAQDLNLSQPAVTKQVKALEDELGSRLIIREGRRLQLTSAGEVTYPYARRVLHTLQECREALAGLTAPGRGSLGIAAVPTIALFTLPGLLAEYARQHPLVSVRLRTGTNPETASMVLRNEVDVGMLPMPYSHEEIETLPLFQDPVLLISNPKASWARQGYISPVDLSRIPMISYRRGSQFRGFVDANFDAAGIAPNSIMEFDSHEAVRTMVMLGFGVAMLPETCVAEDLEAGRLLSLKIAGFAPLVRTTSLILRRDHPRSDAVADFIDLLRATFPADARR